MMSFGAGVGVGGTGGGGILGDDAAALHAYEPLSEDAALALDEWGGNALPAGTSATTTSTIAEWTSEDVAKGLQDYLICIEMLLAAMVHIFVFSHTEYDPQAVEARERALHQLPHHGHYKRLGRRHNNNKDNNNNNNNWDNRSAYSGTTLTSSGYPLNNNNGTMELVPMHEAAEHIMYRTPDSSVDEEEDLLVHPLDRMEEDRRPLLLDTVHDTDEENDDGSFYSLASSELNDEEDDDDDDETDEDDDDDDEQRNLLPSPPRKPAPGFVKALLDSAIPQDLRDNTVGIIKGEYVVERKTLLHHAATSDSYDLFSRVPKLKKTKQRESPQTMIGKKEANKPNNNDNVV
jgi:hypothetical protein